MQTPTLVILAAGMGSRYGGLKQIDAVDDYGNLIIDYSAYDALRAGFSDVVCIIKHEIEQDFKNLFYRPLQAGMRLTYAYQEIDDLPSGFSVPPGREKPWGTGHALLCARQQIQGPFAIINADDYYGPHAFRSIYAYLLAAHEPGEYAMVNYILENTLTDNGEVTRGVCAKGQDGYLAYIEEVQGIRRDGGGGACRKDGRDVHIPAGTPVSMNFWGFDQSIFQNLSESFPSFLQSNIEKDPFKCEYQLPTAIQGMLHAGKARVTMLESKDAWFGVTYREDKAAVRESIQKLKAQGLYPEKLWT